MIKRNFVYCLLLLVVSCQSPTFKIKGKLPANKYDGEWVFLVPMEKHTVADVDSTIIKNGEFSFSGTVERIAIIRTRPQIRLELQELLVVTEPGNINVYLAQNSTSSGTPQNDALQRWKTQKENTYLSWNSINKEHKTALRPDSLIYKQKLDSLKKVSQAFNYKLLKELGNNTLGKFIYQNTISSLEENMQAEIDSIFTKANDEIIK